MPIYTYACNSCGLELERRQGFSDPALTDCDACGGPLRKVLHPVGVIFKGSGFYNTDYRKAASNGSKSETDGAAEKTKDGPSADGKAAEPKATESKKDSGDSSKSSKSESTSKTPASIAKE